MRWFKREVWKAGITVAGLLFLLVFMVWLFVPAAEAQGGASGLTMPGTATVQATPTVDPTMTALQKEQLTLQVKQLQDQLQDQNNWVANNSTALIAAFTTIVVALFGIYQWAENRRDERRKQREAQDKESKDRQIAQDKELEDRKAAQDKDLQAQAEERFKTAVTALGDEKEGAQVGGAILLRSFLNPDDKKSYERYYTQIFDLAVAYLRHPRATHHPDDSDGPSSLPEQSDTPQPITPLSQALIVVFKEAFPLARDRLKEQDPKSTFHPPSLDATSVNLDSAYLVGADLEQVWMPQASVRNVDLSGAKLSGANFNGAKLSGAKLSGAKLRDAGLIEADLRNADLRNADLRQAKLLGADLSAADLRWTHLIEANLSAATLSRTNLTDVRFLEATDLRGVKGVTKEQLAICKAKGAIIDKDTTSSSPQPAVLPSPSSQSDNVQAPSVPSAQTGVITPDADGSGATSSQQGPTS